MTCDNCGRKMRCRYSVPTGLQLRFRTYKCKCGTFLTTFEMPERMFMSGRDREDVAAVMDGAKRAQMRFALMKKKGATSVKAGPS